MQPQDMAQAWYHYHQYFLLAAILLLPLLIVKLRPPRKHGKNLPPGPWRLPIIGSLHHLVGALPHRAMRDLARRHGPLMLLRMGEIDVVVASSADAAREVMKTHDLVFATRPQTATFRALSQDGSSLALAPYGEHWRQMRKLYVTELLNTRRVRSFRGSREAEAANLVASIASLASESPSKPMNISSLITTHVTDSSMRAIVGDRIKNRDALLAILEYGIKIAAGFSLTDVFPSSCLARVFSGVPLARRAEASLREMNRLMDIIIEDQHTRTSVCRSASYDEENILDVLLRIQRDGMLPVPLDVGAIRVVVRDLFGGGSETIAATLQWAMAELMGNPAALQRVQAEVRSALAGQSRVTEEALPKLPYVKLVIKETLRLHATVPLLVPRECQEPCRILGYDMPEGAMVLVNAWAIGRDSATWGDDAEEFKPERFEEGGATTVDFRGAHFNFVPFGADRRMCPGIAFALVTMELALASLLLHFDWELPRGGSPEELDMEEAVGITVSKKSDMWLHATVRVPPATS